VIKLFDRYIDIFFFFGKKVNYIKKKKNYFSETDGVNCSRSFRDEAGTGDWEEGALMKIIGSGYSLKMNGN
jgi:hypothetical protein